MCPEFEYHTTIKKTLSSLESVINFQSKTKDNTNLIMNQNVIYDSFNTPDYFQSVFELQESLNNLSKNCYFIFLYKNNLVNIYIFILILMFQISFS
jgi:hypothetical protein